MPITAWKCEVCGYVHQGDAPPDLCPICGVGPESFSRIEIDVQAAAATPAAATAAQGWRCTICDYVHRGAEPPDACPICAATRDHFEPHAEAAPAAASIGAAEPPQRLVIVGAGIAGVTAAEQARRVSPELAITIVSKEPGLPYYRLNLTRFLAGEVSEDQLALRDRSWLEQQRVELLEGEVAAIEREEGALLLRDGHRLAYDRLLLATGAHSFVPPIPGATREGVHVFRSAADARAIAAQSEGRRCIVIGGGLLGLETAGALARRGSGVVVLEGFDWLLPRQLPVRAGRLLRAHLEALGIAVRCGVQVKEIVGDERAAGVRLADGGEIAGGLVVIAAGVRPNSFLARQTGLDVRGGVVVDDRLATSDPRIFAAGDAAEHRGTVYGIWPAAYAQGAVAGVNAAGGSATFAGLPPANSLKVLDIDLLSIGRIEPEDGSYQVVEEEGERWHRRLVCRDGHLVGAALYGDTSLSSLVRSAIEESVPLLQAAELLARVPGLAERCAAAAAGA